MIIAIADALTPGDTVTLWEDNAGGLYLHHDGAATVYEMTDLQEQASFEADAVALLGGDTDDWIVPEFDATPTFFEGMRVIAEYDGASGALRVRGKNDRMYDLDDLAGWVISADDLAAGIAGRRYIGPLHYVSATGTGEEEATR